MDNEKIVLGDLIEQIEQNTHIYLKRGLVVASDTHCFTVKWFSYNKKFFIPAGSKFHKSFLKLNEEYLLKTQTYSRKSLRRSFKILNKVKENELE
jgi:hypothetical protein